MRQVGLMTFLVLILMPYSVHAQQPAWSGIITSPRAIDWSTVGSPAVASSTSWTQCGSTIAAGASTATINAALAACTPNHYVQLGAGTFSGLTGLTFGQNNNIKLVGMGANQTLLVFSNTNGCQGFVAGICMASADLNYVLNQSNTANWTANYSAGTTSITLDAKTNLAVGTPIVLDQLDDTTDGGNLFVCYQSNGTLNCSTNGDNGGYARTNRGQQQIVTVTSISGGSCPCTIGITPGIYMPNWASGKTPQAWWATSPVKNMGVENLSINMTNSGESLGNGFSVQMFNCTGCWVKGIRSIDPGRSHVQVQVSTDITIQDSYFYRTVGATSTSYGAESAGASAVLVQNNIFEFITEPMSLNGNCSGCVEGYNFDVNDVFDTTGGGTYNWRMASSLPHAVGIAHILIEGNQGSGLEADIIHGSHNFITAFRNSYNGCQQDNGHLADNNYGPMIVAALNRSFNLIGNVLGCPTTDGASTGYMTGSNPIYNIGASFSQAFTVPADPNVQRTIMLWGNYDTFTAAVRWCGNSSDTGWSTTCASTTEVPSGISVYPNSIPTQGDTGAGQGVMPASFYLSSQPSWWPSAKPWPPIGPDVTGGNLRVCNGGVNGNAYVTTSGQCPSGSLGTLAGHANTIPAADCFLTTMGGSPIGTDASALSFDASACYGTTVATNLPQPPTNLSATVN
jgi:hypothetical protein